PLAPVPPAARVPTEGALVPAPGHDRGVVDHQPALDTGLQLDRDHRTVLGAHLLVRGVVVAMELGVVELQMRAATRQGRRRPGVAELQENPSTARVSGRTVAVSATDR